MTARKLRIVDSGQAGYRPGRWQVQYWDADVEVWADLGDPCDTYGDALAKKNNDHMQGGRA